MTTTLYKNLYFYSLLHGKFKIIADEADEGGEMRYGGWTALKRPADGVWVKDYCFYTYKSKDCGSSCGSTVYTIPSTNVIFVKGYNAGSYSIVVKGYNAGSYSIGSLFDAYAWVISHSALKALLMHI
ncbi:hypothetical protein Ngar_c22730 [Candidatus Nitrososphaera gargensis Ga9.2]|uniref:Uncharacterized protein n=1 Tax=Nitrososphaera gargensis (strain Ga9.2) TaxID=1237085 RepID=K0IJB9_NITGG|nr:hypothetical protein [Candidatus Nitrososphaera gargensis]AFU59203.1 hypothetical protein Ngar_c22730 [Candidatus Nitrososphaera gargensis Ga9.2]